MSAEADPIVDLAGRPLYVCVEIAANLVYLARNTLGEPELQQQYLDRAADILLELRHHPQLQG
jgi:hypothetical protein